MNAWHDKDNILDRFRQWLDEAQTEAGAVTGGQPPSEEESGEESEEESEEEKELPSVGLYQFVAGLTALRHELKLQTKSSRSLAERSEATLEAMQEAIELFRSVEAKESQAAQQAAGPLVQSLLDLDEALRRGRTVIETARRRVLEDLTGELQDQLDELYRRQPRWRRWICRRWHNATREILLQRAALGHRHIFDSLIEGYNLILNRLQRVMKKEGIYRIQCKGKPVDPNTMTVIEAVDDPLRPPGLVLEEVRPGYYWKDKVVRFAEVRAVQGKTS